jgi:hypothetical protein
METAVELQASPLIAPLCRGYGELNQWLVLFLITSMLAGAAGVCRLVGR